MPNSNGQISNTANGPKSWGTYQKRAQTDCKKQTTKKCPDMYKEDAIILITAIIIVIFVTNALENIQSQWSISLSESIDKKLVSPHDLYIEIQFLMWCC